MRKGKNLTGNRLKFFNDVTTDLFQISEVGRKSNLISGGKSNQEVLFH